MSWFMVVPVVAFAVWSVFRNLKRSWGGKACPGNCGSCSGCPWAAIPRDTGRYTEDR